MIKTRFSPSLLNSYHALAVLAGMAFLISLVSPGRVGGLGGYTAFLGAPFFLATMAVLTGILGLHVGGAEVAWWRERGLSPGRQVTRLAGLVGLGLLLFLPFLIALCTLTGGEWKGVLLEALFLLLCGLAWGAAGFFSSAHIKSGGGRFLVVYGGLVVVNFAPLIFASPLSPVVTSISLWRGSGPAGTWGLVLYGGLDLFLLGGWYIWSTRASSGRSDGGPGRAVPFG